MSAERLKPFLPVIGVIGLVAIWSFVTWQKWVDPVLLPSPIETGKALCQGGGTYYLERHGRLCCYSSRPTSAGAPPLRQRGVGSCTGARRML